MLKTVYGKVVFSRSKMQARHKSLEFFPFTCHLFLLLKALQSFVSLLEVLEVFRSPGMVWKVLEGSAGFARFCEAICSFERLWEAF